MDLGLVGLEVLDLSTFRSTLPTLFRVYKGA